MKKTYHKMIMLIIMSSLNLFAGPFDSGFIEWNQPNGVTFVARHWGDEFQWWMRTDNGYSIIKGNDGWYYYAQLDDDGEFTPSSSSVSIDLPIDDSFQLERSISRQEQIDAEIREFNLRVFQNRQRYKAKRDASIGRSIIDTLGVILVDFTPSLRYKEGSCSPDGCIKDIYDKMFFSNDSSWNGSQGNTIHPEGDALFGSFREYYLQQSIGFHDVVGIGTDGTSILNPNMGGFPLWVKLDHPKSHYLESSYDYFHKSVINEFGSMMDSLINEGILIDTIGVTKWAIFYAGNDFTTGGIIVAAFPAGDYGGPDSMYSNFKDFYVMSERWRNKIIDNDSGFTHIGQQVHEFGHLLGAADEYYDSDLLPVDPQKWAVMSIGIYNGPQSNNVEGACPAGFSPPYRAIEFGWVSDSLLNESTFNMTLNYDYFQPEYFRINIPNSQEYFIIENRLRKGFDEYTPIVDSLNLDYWDGDPNGSIGGLLIWHADLSMIGSGTNSESDFVELEYANGDSYTNDNTPPDDWFNYFGHPFTFGNNDQSFNSSTLPSSKTRDGKMSGIAINNISWNGENNSINIGEITSLETAEANINILDGWNLLGLPLQTFSPNYENIFPNAVGVPLTFYNNEYIQEVDLSIGKGYWLYFPNESYSLLEGIAFSDINISLSTGWNLISGISYPVNVSSITDPNHLIVPETFYEFNGSYISANTLTPGKGYWVLSNNDGQITISNDESNNQLLCSSFLQSSSSLKLTNNNNKTCRLYFDGSIPNDETNRYSLPPVPEYLNDIFDVRNSTNEKYIEEGDIINVRNSSYPIIISFENNSDESNEWLLSVIENGGKITADSATGVFTETFILKEEEIITISKPIKNLVLSKISNDQIPNNFILYNSYPNPFNSSTVIKYSLPNHGNVNFIIYDILGRIIKTIFIEHDNGGLKQLIWDGTNETGADVSSGVYLCTMKFGSTQRTTKITLLK